MSKQVGHSPLARVPEMLNYPDALRAVIDGRNITKLEWNDRETFGQLRDRFLMLYKDGKWHRWIVNDGDLLGKDWYVL